MSEHRTIYYAAESEDNARIVVEPINARLREAGWREVSSVWSEDAPGFWEEEFKGRIWAHASAGGRLAVIYERNLSLPILPSLQAAIDAAAPFLPGVAEAVRRFARVAQQTHLPIGRELTLMDALSARETFMGAFLLGRLERNPDLLQAYQALPPRLRLEIERADTDAFFAKYAV